MERKLATVLFVDLVSSTNLVAASDPEVVRRRVQRYFDDVGGYPPLWADDEYAFYFERAYPDEADRRTYIEQKVRAATPSYGHLVLAETLQAELIRLCLLPIGSR